MQVRKFLAPDIRQAIEALREELGPDAVILSNRRVDGGIELVASLDYEEPEKEGEDASKLEPVQRSLEVDEREAEVVPVSQDERAGAPEQAKDPYKYRHLDENAAELASMEMKRRKEKQLLVKGLKNDLRDIQSLLDSQLDEVEWQSLKKQHPYRAQLIEQLQQLGFDRAIAEEVFAEVSEELDFTQAWRVAMNVLAQRLQVTRDDILTHGGVVMLLGPTGVGKTTSVAKLAAGYAMRHGAEQVALVTTDCFRIGALEQLRTYGRILGVPVRAAASTDELVEAVQSLCDKKLILIDTAGIGPREEAMLSQFESLRSTVGHLKSYLVLSASTHPRTLEKTIGSYAGKGVNGTILTKLDESTALGDVLSLCMKHSLPVAYVSDGQRVPEDLHQARSHTLIKQSEEIYRYFRDDIDGEDTDDARMLSV